MTSSSIDDYTRFFRRLEELKKVAPNGTEIWRGRDLQAVLDYTVWENFDAVVRKAVVACEGAKGSPSHHFRETTEMVAIGSGAKRTRADWILSRGACYLIAMNADPGKAAVAYAQTYFAAQTRRQEISDEQRRLRLRLRVIDANKSLNSTARRSGVHKFPLFHDAGYRGLYGGRGLSDIKRYKGLSESEDLLDRAGRAELAANEFRLTQTDQKIVRERISGEQELIATHRAVGQEVRSSIERMNGTMPEDLLPEPSIKALVAKHRRQVKAGNQPD